MELEMFVDYYFLSFFPKYSTLSLSEPANSRHCSGQKGGRGNYFSKHEECWINHWLQQFPEAVQQPWVVNAVLTFTDFLLLWL